MLPKFPCNVCSRACRDGQEAIQCDVCNKWVHKKCTKLTNDQFVHLGSSTMSYFCQPCISNLLPFYDVKNNDNNCFNTGNNCSNVKKDLSYDSYINNNSIINRLLISNKHSANNNS